MIGRADIEGSKSNVAMNAWLPQASYYIEPPNFSYKFLAFNHKYIRCSSIPWPNILILDKL